MDVLDHIYEAIADEQTLARLPDVLARGIGGRSCALQHFAPSGMPLEFRFSYFSPEMVNFWSENSFYLTDPWRDLGTHPDLIDRPIAFDDYRSVAEIRATPWFREMIAHFGDDTDQCVGGGFIVDQGLLAVGIQRCGTTGVPTTEQCRRLTSYVPHLKRLYNMRGRLGTLIGRSRMLEDVLGTLATPIFLCDENGRLHFVNVAGKGLLDQRDGMALVQGRLVLADYKAQMRLTAALLGTVRDMTPGEALSVPRGDNKVAHHVMIAPKRINGVRRALLLIDDPSRSSRHKAEWIGEIYGLTAMEIETLKALVTGKTPEETADQRSIKLATVRTQIQQILSKAEMRRITDLIALAARLPDLTP